MGTAVEEHIYDPLDYYAEGAFGTPTERAAAVSAKHESGRIPPSELDRLHMRAMK